jgi:capsular polysaccharide transport system ATP-binding protein
MIVCDQVKKSYPLGSGRKNVLRGVDLTIARGQRVGLLGRNGAGKSTLIRLIGGVEMPSSGVIRRTMTLSWPLGLNGGFQGSLTGYDNARFIARIYGHDYKDLKGFVEDFSELGSQLKMPVKTYSAGMRARLAFALSLAIDFDCYLVDEVILVGDQSFFRKCREELLVKRHDRSLIFASHSDALIREYCHSAVVLNDGYARSFTGVEEALDVYNAL